MVYWFKAITFFFRELPLSVFIRTRVVISTNDCGPMIVVMQGKRFILYVNTNHPFLREVSFHALLLHEARHIEQLANGFVPIKCKGQYKMLVEIIQNIFTDIDVLERNLMQGNKNAASEIFYHRYKTLLKKVDCDCNIVCFFRALELWQENLILGLLPASEIESIIDRSLSIFDNVEELIAIRNMFLDKIQFEDLTSLTITKILPVIMACFKSCDYFIDEKRLYIFNLSNLYWS